MQAVIVTSDKLSSEVIRTGLLDRGFQAIDIRIVPDKAGIQSSDAMDKVIVFLDLDASWAHELYDSLANYGRIIGFGSFDSRKAVKNFPESKFMIKPFDSNKLQTTLTRVLTDYMQLANSYEVVGEPSQEVHQTWLDLSGEVKLQRANTKAILHAAPEQLKMMLFAQAATMGVDPAGPRFESVMKEILPLKRVLIVNSDANVNRMLMKFLSMRSVFEVDVRDTGLAGWNALQESDYDLVIFDWSIKDFSALTLYNRIRSSPRLKIVPLMVISEQLSQKDFKLLDDDMLLTLGAVPLHERIFLDKIDFVVVSSVIAKKFLSPLCKIISDLIREGALTKILPSMRDDLFFTSALKMVGDRFVQEENFSFAERAYVASWSLGDRRLSVATAYAKVLHFQGKYEEAHKLLVTADAISPQNVERLCLIGEIDLAMNNLEEAEHHFSKALAIDPASVKPSAGKNIAKAMSESDEKAAGPMPSEQFSSYLNMIGIHLSRSVQTDKALSYYNSALHFVHGNEKKAKLWFNIGMCHMRASDQEKAQNAFKKALDLSGGTLEKAAKYIVDASPNSGEKTKIHSLVSGPIEEPEYEDQKQLAPS